jgi:two-component sensor histidine kinase
LYRALGNLALVGAAALAAAVFVAVLLGRQLSQAVWSLTRADQALKSGVPVAAPRTGLRETDEVGRALATAARNLASREEARATAAGALRETDERFRVVLLAAPIIAYTCDRELRYTWITNPRREVTQAALIGRRDDEVEGLGATPQEIRALMELKREVVQTGRGARRDLRWTGPDGMVSHYDVAVEPLRDEETGEVVGATVAALDITARVRAMEALQEQESRQRLLINELNHRVKNTLAAVQSIAAQTLRAASDTEAARAQLQDRLLALAAAHDVLTRQSWEGASLTEVLTTALAPHRPAEPERLRLEGPPVWLTPRAALAFSLAAHELATNAAKYGALKPGSPGRVAVTWSLGVGRRLQLRWEESGGPAVEGAPARRGFGTRLIERGLAQDLGGKVRLDFAPGGLVCTVEAVLPLPEEPLALTSAETPAPGQLYHSP